jgi:hypothetical protein
VPQGAPTPASTGSGSSGNALIVLLVLVILGLALIAAGILKRWRWAHTIDPDTRRFIDEEARQALVLQRKREKEKADWEIECHKGEWAYKPPGYNE